MSYLFNLGKKTKKTSTLRYFIEYIIGYPELNKEMNGKKILIKDFAKDLKYTTSREDILNPDSEYYSIKYEERPLLMQEVLNYIGQNNEFGKTLLILGEIGYGKTRFMLQLLENLLNNAPNLQNLNHRKLNCIPYFFKYSREIKLERIKDRITEFKKQILKQIEIIANKDLSVNEREYILNKNLKEFIQEIKDLLEKELSNSLFIFLFDGINELLDLNYQPLNDFIEYLLSPSSFLLANAYFILASQSIGALLNQEDIRRNKNLILINMDAEKFMDENQSIIKSLIDSEIMPIFQEYLDKNNDEIPLEFNIHNLKQKILEKSKTNPAYIIGLKNLLEMSNLNHNNLLKRIIADFNVIPNGLFGLFDEYLIVLYNRTKHTTLHPEIKLISAIYYAQEHDLFPIHSKDYLEFSQIDDPFNADLIPIFKFIVKEEISKEISAYYLNYHFYEYLGEIQRNFKKPSDEFSEQNPRCLAKIELIETIKKIEAQNELISWLINSIKDKVEKRAIKRLIRKYKLKYQTKDRDFNRGYAIINKGVYLLEISEYKSLFSRIMLPRNKNIFKLKNLKILILSYNNLSSISKNISNLKNLKELYLYENKLSSLPESIGKLINLKELNLEKNNLSSLPESIGDLKNLTWLFLRKNQLSSLPESIGDLKNLTYLNLYYNQLSSLPESIGNLINLQRLDLYYNILSSLPESIGSLKNLQKLHLGWNKLSSLPESIGSLSNLKNLDLSVNKLSSLPEIITKMTWLKELGLGWNKLSSLPESIANLNKLEKLDLSGNKLSSLPESIGNLNKLETLNLHDNYLSSLPESIGTLKNLQTLILWNNNLSSLPESIGNLINLKELYLYENKLSSLPESIAKLKNLEKLYLHRNNLSSLPESIANLKNLTYLSLRENQLSSLPERIKTQLRKLKRHGCSIYGIKL